MSQSEQTPPPGELAPEDRAAPAVWPPPPVGQTDPSQLSAAPFGVPFRSGASLAVWITVFLGLGIACDLSGLFIAPLRSDDHNLISALFAVLQGLLLIVTGILFFVWTYRSYKNLSAFDAGGLKTTPGWAVGYFFVPFLNLVRPLQAFKEMWRASAITAPDAGRWAWTSTRSSPLVLSWWLLWLLKGVCDNIVSQFPDNYGDNGVYIRFTAFSHLASVAAAVCAIFVVRGITARQEAKWKSLTSPIKSLSAEATP